MAKRKEYRNVHLVVGTRLFDDNDPQALAECERIARDIKRHVDDCYVNLSRTTVEVCADCGYDWEEDAEGIPQCCNKAQEEVLAAKGATPEPPAGEKNGL